MTTPGGGRIDIDALLRGLGAEALRREAEAMGLSLKGDRLRCPFQGCADKGPDRDRDAQLFATGKPRVFCFACSQGGDLLDLVQLARGLSRQEALAALQGVPMPARPPPQLRVVGSRPPSDEEGKLSPAEVKRIWDSLAETDTQAVDYLQGRGLDDAGELGLVRFATEEHPNGGVKAQARKGYRIAALLTDVVGNPRGIQLRLVRAPRAREPKIMSVKGSSSSRAFFGQPDSIEAEPIVAVAEGLADTLALGLWTKDRAGVAAVGAAGKGALARLAEELADSGIAVTGKYFVLFPQNDRPKNQSRKEFVRLGQLLKQQGARVVFAATPDEFKDLAEWLQARPDTEWPPPELRKAVLPEPGEDTPRPDAPVLPTGSAVPVPGRVTAEVYRQDFTTLCALLDDPLTREAVIGPGELTWCEMTCSPRVGGRRLAESDLAAVRLGLEAQGRSTDGKPLKFGVGDIAQALSMLARRRTTHPVRDYLQRLTWDGKERLELELPQLLGHQAAGLEARLLFRWFLSAVARAMRPGCKVDTVLVLIGDQGTRKSSFFDALGGEWFTDAPVAVGDTDGMMVMREKWIVEWAELDAMRRARDQESIKAFLSARVDFFRAPYARAPSEAPRHSVIVGTSNNPQFLHDSTGNRRFWPVEVLQRIDIDWVRAHREQLWAEAVASYRKGEQWWLTDEEDELLRDVHKQHEVHDAWHDVIGDWCESHFQTEVTAAQVLHEALKKDVDSWSDGDAKRVAKVLQALGWKPSKRLTYQGRMRRGYARP